MTSNGYDIVKGDPALSEFPRHSYDKLRYADTDRQGHINNAVFSTFLETGRVELLHDVAFPLAEPGTSFVLARLELDLRREMRWPGEVTIGTAIGVRRTNLAEATTGIFTTINV